METRKLSFDVDASQIDIKPLLKKEFLELTMRPISTANPNRNKSWFTRESLVNSLDTFKNKPILGYFENGDFVSHNGQWKQDPETKLDYWDTVSVKGERPLGLIRENDERVVIDDPETGLSWVCITCALWTQYNYKQVKRLLKDAKKAKQNGGPVKNVSVEVDITDWEDLPNGIMKINAFNLVGITILGSRNGVKVEPGIEDAELSVVDIMGTDLYEKQMQSLRLAYEKLDGSEKTQKEEFSEMLENEENLQTGTEVEAAAGTEPANDGTTLATEGEGSQEAQFAAENHDPEQQTDPENVIHENNEQHVEGEEPTTTEEPAQEPVHQNHEDQGQICDMTWLIDRLSGAAGSLKCSLEYYEAYADSIEGSDYIIPVLKRVYSQTVENEKELIGLLAKVAEGLTDDDKQLALEQAEHFDCKVEYANYCDLLCKYNDLMKQCEELKTSKEALDCKFAEIEKAEAHANFMKEAKAIIASAKFENEIAVSFEKDCEEEKITTLDDLKNQIGLKLFELKAAEEAAPATEPEQTEAPATFSAPVNTPEMNAFTEEETKKVKKDKWERLREIIKE